MIICVALVVCIGISLFFWLVKADMDADFKNFEKDLHIKHFKEVNKK